MKRLTAIRFQVLLSKVLLVVLTSVTSGGSAQCDGRSLCELSEDNTQCTVTVMKEATAQCCMVDSCQSTAAGMHSFDPDSLEVRINYTSPMSANIIAQWKYTEGGTTSFPLQISVTQMSNSESELETLCLCLPQDVTTFVTTLNYPVSICPTVVAASKHLKVQMLTSNVLESQVVAASKEINLSDCWATMGKDSHDICGPAIPSHPQHVAAVVTASDAESITVQVTWDTPVEGNTPNIVYDVDLETNLLLAPIHQYIPENITKYSLVFAHAITAADDPVIKVRAGIRLSGSDSGQYLCPCCLRQDLGEEEYAVFGSAATSPVQWPVADNKLVIIIGSSVGACVLIITSILVGVVIVAVAIKRRHKRRHTSKDAESLLPNSVNL